MIGLVIAALLVIWCARAFTAAEPGPSPVELISRVVRRFLVSLDRIEAVTQRQRSFYDSWSELAGSRTPTANGTED